jgi:hypothetical protein
MYVGEVKYVKASEVMLVWLEWHSVQWWIVANHLSFSLFIFVWNSAERVKGQYVLLLNMI